MNSTATGSIDGFYVTDSAAPHLEGNSATANTQFGFNIVTDGAITGLGNTATGNTLGEEVDPRII